MRSRMRLSGSACFPAPLLLLPLLLPLLLLLVLLPSTLTTTSAAAPPTRAARFDEWAGVSNAVSAVRLDEAAGGLVARRGLSRGEVLLAVPASAVLSMHSMVTSTRLSADLHRLQLKLTPRQLVALHLADRFASSLHQQWHPIPLTAAESAWDAYLDSGEWPSNTARAAGGKASTSSSSSSSSSATLLLPREAELRSLPAYYSQAELDALEASWGWTGGGSRGGGGGGGVRDLSAHDLSALRGVVCGKRSAGGGGGMGSMRGHTGTVPSNPSAHRICECKGGKGGQGGKGGGGAATKMRSCHELLKWSLSVVGSRSFIRLPGLNSAVHLIPGVDMFNHGTDTTDGSATPDRHEQLEQLVAITASQLRETGQLPDGGVGPEMMGGGSGEGNEALSAKRKESAKEPVGWYGVMATRDYKEGDTVLISYDGHREKHEGASGDEHDDAHHTRSSKHCNLDMLRTWGFVAEGEEAAERECLPINIALDLGLYSQLLDRFALLQTLGLGRVAKWTLRRSDDRIPPSVLAVLRVLLTPPGKSPLLETAGTGKGGKELYREYHAADAEVRKALLSFAGRFDDHMASVVDAVVSEAAKRRSRGGVTGGGDGMEDGMGGMGGTADEVLPRNRANIDIVVQGEKRALAQLVAIANQLSAARNGDDEL